MRDHHTAGPVPSRQAQAGRRQAEGVFGSRCGSDASAATTGSRGAGELPRTLTVCCSPQKITSPARIPPLAGLYAAPRRTPLTFGLAVTVRLYVDDSGGKRQPTPAVFAGLLHTDNEWASFSEAWRSALDREPRVWRHKMDDAAGLDGAYRGMTSEDRDRKLRALATV